MRYPIATLLGTLILLIATPRAEAKDLITVPVGVLEALAETESSPSLRYKEQYQAALFYGLGRAEKELHQCGYRIRLIERYFEPTDKVTAANQAEDLKRQEVWATIGPRRSDHTLVVAPALKGMPLISPMANAAQVIAMKPPFFTLADSSDELAKAAIRAIKKEGWTGTYGSIVDATCPACRDFEKSFDAHAEKDKGKFIKAFQIETSGDSPDLAPLFQKLKAQPIRFLLVPNYAALSSYVMLKTHEAFPDVNFIGADGWGDGNVGYFNRTGFKADTKAITVRNGASKEQMSQIFSVYSLDRQWAEGVISPPDSAYYLTHILATLTHQLCEQKPATAHAFAQKLKSLSPSTFKPAHGISVWRLKNSKLEFAYSIGSAKSQ